MFGLGISSEGDILDLAVTGDIVEKTGAWYSFEDLKIGQGRENAKTFLTDNDDILKSITEKVKSFMGINGEVVEADA